MDGKPGRMLLSAPVFDQVYNLHTFDSVCDTSFPQAQDAKKTSKHVSDSWDLRVDRYVLYVGI